MMTIMVGKAMTSTWTAEQRDRYSAGLTIFSPKTPLLQFINQQNRIWCDDDDHGGKDDDEHMDGGAT
jgi:hypothetical protein